MIKKRGGVAATSRSLATCDSQQVYKQRCAHNFFFFVIYFEMIYYNKKKTRNIPFPNYNTSFLDNSFSFITDINKCIYTKYTTYCNRSTREFLHSLINYLLHFAHFAIRSPDDVRYDLEQNCGL